MNNTKKCHRCGKLYESLRPCEGDLHVTVLQLGDRGGLEHDQYDLCNTCKRELGSWLHGQMVQQAKMRHCGNCMFYNGRTKKCMMYGTPREKSDPDCTGWGGDW